jgi:hypothetical protein
MVNFIERRPSDFCVVNDATKLMGRLFDIISGLQQLAPATMHKVYNVPESYSLTLNEYDDLLKELGDIYSKFDCILDDAESAAEDLQNEVTEATDRADTEESEKDSLQYTLNSGAQDLRSLADNYET